MHVDPPALNSVVHALDRIELGPTSVEEWLGDASVAIASLMGVAGCGLMLADEGEVYRYVAATDEAARLLEEVQEEVGVGPCIDCVVQNALIVSDDLAQDDRWPLVSEAVVGHGVASLMGAPVVLGGAPVGSLNVYDDKPRAWDDSDRGALSTLARSFEHTLGTALRNRQSDTLVQQLQHALDNRVVIERAVGYAMASRDLDAVDAFNLLRREARNQRAPVVDVARRVLTDRSLPGDP